MRSWTFHLPIPKLSLRLYWLTIVRYVRFWSPFKVRLWVDLHLANPNTTTSERSRLEQLLNIVVTLSCCGMPPNYPRRFLAARREYRRTLQPAQWQSFIDQVKRERVAANVMVRSHESIYILSIYRYYFHQNCPFDHWLTNLCSLAYY